MKVNRAQIGTEAYKEKQKTSNRKKKKRYIPRMSPCQEISIFEYSHYKP